jgi:acyl carrier protein
MPYVTDPRGLDEASPKGCSKQGLASERVIALVTEACEFPPDLITPDTHFAHDIGLDSLEYLVLLRRLKEVFDIRIPNPDKDGIETVGHLIAYIERRIAEVP